MNQVLISSSNRITTAMAVLCNFFSETLCAVNMIIVVDVWLAGVSNGQRLVTAKAAKVFLVPFVSLSYCEVVTENQLITSMAAWQESLPIVTTTVKFVILVEVDQGHKEFTVGFTSKAGRVPHMTSTANFRLYSHLSWHHGLLTPPALCTKIQSQQYLILLHLSTHWSFFDNNFCYLAFRHHT
jgi:hypothetical protein